MNYQYNSEIRDLTTKYIDTYSELSDEEKEQAVLPENKDSNNSEFDFELYKARLSKIYEFVDYYLTVVEASIVEDEEYTMKNVDWIKQKSDELKDELERYI